jgi:hypothetical protein
MTVELSKPATEADYDDEFRRFDDAFRFRYRLVVRLVVVGLLLALFTYLFDNITDSQAQLRADRAELAKWREAAETCTYMERLGVAKLEAACYRASFKDGDALDTAMKQCHGAIRQCNTATALSPPLPSHP